MVKKHPKKLIYLNSILFYAVTSGQRKGIYTDYNEALEAAWLSNNFVTIHGMKAKAELAFKK